MDDNCQCGISSANLLSVEYFSFTCDLTNPNAVNFSGYIYGSSLTTETTYLMDAYYQWVNATSPVDVFGDILYTNQCEVSQTTSPPTTSESQSLRLILGVTVGVSAVFVCMCCCACLAYCFFWKHKKKQAHHQQRQHATNQRASSGQHMQVISEQYTIYHGRVPGINDQQVDTGDSASSSHKNSCSSPPTYEEAEKLV